MPAPLVLDTTFALDTHLGAGRGIPSAAYGAAVGLFADHAAWLAAQRAAGRLEFLDLVLDEGPAEAVAAWAASAPAMTDVVLVGIGGSALTARIVEALRPVDGRAPRMHVLDTVDPVAVARLHARLDPATTQLIGISKSGGTLEMAAVLPLFEAWLQAALGKAAAGRVAIVCGEDPNPLRAYAEARGYVCFDVPRGVGGRFSGLTPVGLLPAACLGLDPRALLRGGAALHPALLSANADHNPALALAALHYAAQRQGRHVAVLWPYGEVLAPLGPWWAQLVGESLGKPGPEGPTGVTPLAARGPADQHSLLQLLVEGPDDKLTVFVTVEGDHDLVVPAAAGDLCRAAGRSLQAILEAEQEATAFALAEAGRPTATLRLAAADAASVGAFLLTWELAVVLWGRLLGVDPFGQPGVELGKQAAMALLTGEPADLAARMAARRSGA